MRPARTASFAMIAVLTPGCAGAPPAATEADPSASGSASASASTSLTASSGATDPSSVAWTERPRLAMVPAGPVHGVFDGKRFALDEVKLIRGGGGDWRIEGTGLGGDLELKVPVLFGPEEGRCVRRAMGSTLDGRIVRLRGSERRFSNVFAYVVKIDRAALTPYVAGKKHTLEGQRLGTVSGRLLVMFAESPLGPGGPGWVGGTFTDVPVFQHGDRGAEVMCTHPPRAPAPAGKPASKLAASGSGILGSTGLGSGGLGSGALSPSAPSHLDLLRAGDPIRGRIGKSAFAVRGVIVEPRLASDTTTAGWVLRLYTNELLPDLRPKILQDGIAVRGVNIPFDAAPRAGLCVERAADYVVSGPIPELEPMRTELAITSFTAPTPTTSGRASGFVVADWMEGSVVSGAFTDAPVVHREDPRFAPKAPIVAPELCGADE